MRKRVFWTVLITTLITVMVSSVFGQTDLLTSRQAEGGVNLGLYTHDAVGNQDHVREYDGRNFDVWGIESLNSYGYDGPWQYWLNARDLILGDESISLDLSLENRLGLRLSTDALTHRLGRTPAINPYLAGIIYTGGSSPSALSGITGSTPFGDAFYDNTPNTQFVRDRRVNDFGLRHFLGNSQRTALVASWWQESEKGPQQILYYDSPGTRKRMGSAMNIDRSTSNGMIGVDLRLGENSALNYNIQNTEFSDATTFATTGVLDNIRIPDVKATSSVIKANSRINDRLYFTGASIHRNRRSLSAVVPSGYTGAGGHMNSRIRSDATSMSLSFAATDTLSLTGKWRKYELDNLVPPLIATGGTTAANHAVSREQESLGLDASYTGIKYASFRLGLERRDTDRESTHESEFIRSSTESNIWRLGVRYNPNQKLSVSGKLENWDTDNPGYFGQATDSKRTNLNATYLIQDNFAVYGDFSCVDDENREVRVEDIPLQGTDATEAEERELAAGQGYRNKFTTTDFGAWYAVNPKVMIDANFARVKTDADATWIIGFQASYLPHLAPDFAPYNAESNQLSLGISYSVNPKLKTYGRYLHSDSEGQSLFSEIVDGPLEWVPVDVSEKRWTIGLACEVSEKDRVLLDYSTGDWKDKIDSTNNGRYDLWRIAWSTTY